MLESDLQQVFAGFGVVKEAKIITDRESGRSRGFAFVTMENDADADKASADLNGREIGGREIVVNEAHERTAGGSYKGNNGHGGPGIQIVNITEKGRAIQSLSSEKTGYRAALCPRSDELVAGDRRRNQRKDSGQRMWAIKYPCMAF